jgi:hypothetical protein
MSKLIRRLLSLLFTLGIYNKHYTIAYTGEVVSFNQVYSGGHWSKRATVKKGYEEIFTVLLLQAKVKPMTEVSLITFYNSRMDCDNIAYIMKMLVDTLKGKYIQNDGNKFYKSCHTIYDPSLPKGMIQFHLVGK